MSITDVLLILVLIGLAFIALKLHIIAYSVEKVAGVSHYAQQNAFFPSTKVEKVKRADQVDGPETPVKRPITDSPLIDMSELPDDIAIEALENWGTK